MGAINVIFEPYSPFSTPTSSMVRLNQVFSLQKNILWPVRGGLSFPSLTRRVLGLGGPGDCIVPGGSKQTFKTKCIREG